jgi:hypothetical protein
VLWALHHSKFNEWEESFVKSLGIRLRNGDVLSSKQKLHLDRIFKKYKVTGSREQIVKVNKLLNKGKSSEQG